MCINHEDKTEVDFEALKEMFLCTRCYSLVDVISDKLYERVSFDFNNMRLQMQELKSDLLNHINSNKPTNEMPPFSNNSIKPNEETCEDKNDCNEADIDTGKIEEVVFNQKIEEKKKDNIDTSFTKSDIVQITDGTEVENPNAVSPKKKNNYIPSDEVKVQEYYLCGIECELSKEDILFILEDYSISTLNINVSEIEGHFRRKKYIKLTFESAVKYFKFKNSLETSQLKNTWFLRKDPPKVRLFHDIKPFEQKAKTVTVDYKNLARDKILLQNNHKCPSVQNNSSNNSTVQNSIEVELHGSKDKYYRKKPLSSFQSRQHQTRKKQLVTQDHVR